MANQQKHRMWCPGLNTRTNLITSLDAHWPFWEADGSRVMDVAGGNDSVLNGVTWVTSTNGPALDFDGSSNMVVNADNIPPTGANPRTITIRFNSRDNDTSNVRTLLGAAGVGGNGTRFNIYYEDNAISIGFGGHRIITPKGELSLNTWYTVAVVVPSGATLTSDVQIWLNGVNQSLSDEGGGAQALNTANETKYIGSEQAADDFFDGLMDQVGFHNRALTPNEIAQLYADQHILTEPPSLLPLAQGAAAPSFVPYPHIPGMTGGIAV